MWPCPILEFKNVGSDSREQIFLSVGRALTQWEIIESVLGMLFSHLVESDSSAAQRVYGTIVNTGSKQTVIMEAAKIFHDRHYKFPFDELKLLMAHYRHAATYRSAIAHGIAIEHADEQGSSKGVFLVPSFFSTKRSAQTYEFWKKVEKSENDFDVFGYEYRYTHEDIDFFNSKFEELSKMINQFYGELLRVQVEKIMTGEPRFSHDVRGK
jgi:hypothetical protein